MNDDNKCLEQAGDINNIKEIARLEKLAGETEDKLLELKKQIRKLKTKDKHRFRSFLRRLDVVAGLHWMKLLFWIGMADAIIFFLQMPIQRQLVPLLISWELYLICSCYESNKLKHLRMSFDLLRVDSFRCILDFQ